MNGNHRPTGVLILSKPSVSRTARIEDIAPTVLAELGVAGPAMDGASLLRHGETRSDGILPVFEAAYSSQEELDIETRLRVLGYYE